MTQTERKVIKAKVGLLELAKQLGNICPLDDPSGLSSVPGARLLAG